MLSSVPRAIPAPPVLESHKGRLHVERVGLIVRDLDRVANFYRDVMGLEVVGEAGPAVALGVDGRALLILRHEPAAAAPPADMPGLFHTAFLLPSRRDLATWLRHAARLGVPLEGLSNHLVSEAIYLSDPEGNGIEIYVDRPSDTWVWNDGQVRMATARLDVGDLMQDASPPYDGPWRVPSGSRIGHVHLSVASLENAEQALASELGLSVTCRYPGAVFMADGGYHHHVAANIWRRGAQQRREAGFTGLEQVTIAVRDGEARRLDGLSGIAIEIIVTD
jgi:catechol 2,3-dioxygenase